VLPPRARHAGIRSQRHFVGLASLRAPIKEPRSADPNPLSQGVSNGDSEAALVALLGKDAGGLSASIES
jgi:hypothetical protein